MKKILALALIFTMVFALVTPALAASDDVQPVQSASWWEKQSGKTYEKSVTTADFTIKNSILTFINPGTVIIYALYENGQENDVAKDFEITGNAGETFDLKIKFINGDKKIETANWDKYKIGSFIAAETEIEDEDIDVHEHIAVTEVSGVVNKDETKWNGLTGTNARFDVAVDLTFTASSGDDIEVTVVLEQMYYQNKNVFQFEKTVEVCVGCYEVTVLVTLQPEFSNRNGQDATFIVESAEIVGEPILICDL